MPATQMPTAALSRRHMPSAGPQPKSWWQQRGKGGRDRTLDYNKGVGRYPIVWGVEGARGEHDLIILGQSSWDT